MKLSEKLRMIKVENEPEITEIKLTPCSHCVHSYKLTDECQKCGQCGRMFNSKGELIKDV